MARTVLGSIGILLFGMTVAFAQAPPAPDAGSPPRELPKGSSEETPALPTSPPPVTTLPETPTGPYPSAEGGSVPLKKVMDAATEETMTVPYRFWVGAEYLLWWANQGPVSGPLVTTGPATSFGILGHPGVNVLAGNEVNYGAESGYRIKGGVWLDPEAHIGLEGVWFALGRDTVSQSFTSDSTGNPLLARPIVNAQANVESVSPVANPGALTGHADVISTTELWGAEANFLGSLIRGKCWWVDMIVGFRYMGLDEGLSVSNVSTVGILGGAAFGGRLVGPGNTISVWDSFQTQNRFYGGQIGFRSEYTFHIFYVDAAWKVGVGDTHEQLTVTGNSGLSAAGQSTVLPGGLLAVGSNSGVHSNDEFTVMSELTIKVGYCIMPRLGVFAGYNLLYWPGVARPGAQIDRVVDPSQVPTNLAFGQTPTLPRPTPLFAHSQYWAQGLTLGLEFRY